MEECQWDSVVLFPLSPVLTGLQLMFMGVTRSNCCLFSTPGFIVSRVGKRERGEGRKKKRREEGKKEIEQERKE